MEHDMQSLNMHKKEKNIRFTFIKESLFFILSITQKKNGQFSPLKYLLI